MLANNEQSNAAQTLSTVSALSVEALVAQSRAHGEPTWLQDRRAAAYEFYLANEAPRWTRTNLSKLSLAEAAPASDASSTTVQWDESLAAQGVVFTTLKRALGSHSDLIAQYLGEAVKYDANIYNALHAALWQDGVLLYVPKNVVIEQPLHVIYTLSAARSLIAPHTLVILEHGASATLIEEFISPDGLEQPIALPAAEVFVGDSAQLRFCSLQQWGRGVYHIGGQRVIFGRDASCDWVSVALGAQVQHIDAEARLGNDGARVNWLGATFADEDQNLVIAPWLRHASNNTDGYMEFRTVVTDKGYSVFDGMVRIEEDTHGTISRLEEHAVHLSRESRNDSIPGLMIDSNDIARAGHASTSGRIEDEQLFYMQARGIPKDEATRMIVIGFLEGIISAIPVEELCERLVQAIEEKI